MYKETCIQLSIIDRLIVQINFIQAHQSSVDMHRVTGR